MIFTGSNKKVTEIRVSKNTWIQDNESDLVDKISLRINRITGLQTIRKYDEFNEGKKEEYEYMQVPLNLMALIRLTLIQ